MKRLLTAIAALTLVLAPNLPASAGLKVGCDEGESRVCDLGYYPGWNTNPWRIQKPVGSGSPIAGYFKRVVFSGNTHELDEYTQRNGLAYSSVSGRTGYPGGYTLDWQSAGKSGIWATCFDVAQGNHGAAIPVVCVANDKNSMPLDRNIYRDDYLKAVLKAWARKGYPGDGG